MDAADFVPLQPRRYRAASAGTVEDRHVDDSRADAVALVETAGCTDDADLSDSVVNDVPLRDEPPVELHDALSAPVPARPLHLPGDDWPAEFPTPSGDEEERQAQIREDAIRIAAIATARALRTALADDAAALTRYVDDALRACGRFIHAKVALHPADVARYRPRSDIEVVADESSARGDVAVETDAGCVRASIEHRAALLARSAAHA